MRPVKYSNLPKEHHRYAATLPLSDLCPQLNEQGFNIAPMDIGRYRTHVYGLKGLLVFPLHGSMVPHISTK